MTREILEMIAEDPKNFLSRGRNAKARIAANQARIEDWRRIVESITVNLRQDAGSAPGGYKESLVEKAVCNIVELEHDILAEINELAASEKDIREAISLLFTDDRHQTILEMRYVHHMKLEEIAVKLNYAFRWVQRLSSQALASMQEAALSRI